MEGWEMSNTTWTDFCFYVTDILQSLYLIISSANMMNEWGSGVISYSLVHISSGSFTFSSVCSWIPTTTLLLVLQLLILNESGLKFQIEADGLSPSAIAKISANVFVPASSGCCVHSHCLSCPVRPWGNTEWAPRMHYDALTVFTALNLHE